MHLLDANVLLALAWPNHPFHLKSRQWFSRHAARGWATCLLTEAAFIRLSGNPAVVPLPRRPVEAARLLAELAQHGRHEFLTDAKIRTVPCADIVSGCHGHQQVNDAYLVALARSHKRRLVTFDRRLAALCPDPSSIEVLL